MRLCVQNPLVKVESSIVAEDQVQVFEGFRHPERLHQVIARRGEDINVPQTAVAALLNLAVLHNRLDHVPGPVAVFLLARCTPHVEICLSGLRTQQIVRRAVDEILVSRKLYNLRGDACALFRIHQMTCIGKATSNVAPVIVRLCVDLAFELQSAEGIHATGEAREMVHLLEKTAVLELRHIHLLGRNRRFYKSTDNALRGVDKVFLVALLCLAREEVLLKEVLVEGVAERAERDVVRQPLHRAGREVRRAQHVLAPRVQNVHNLRRLHVVHRVLGVVRQRAHLQLDGTEFRENGGAARPTRVVVAVRLEVDGGVWNTARGVVGPEHTVGDLDGLAQQRLVLLPRELVRRQQRAQDADRGLELADVDVYVKVHLFRNPLDGLGELLLVIHQVQRTERVQDRETEPAGLRIPVLVRLRQGLKLVVAPRVPFVCLPAV
eukprot:PhM_4_TR18027/c0_g1_i1/m.93097